MEAWKHGMVMRCGFTEIYSSVKINLSWEGVEPNLIFNSEDGNYWYLKLVLQEMESNTRE